MYDLQDVERLVKIGLKRIRLSYEFLTVIPEKESPAAVPDVRVVKLTHKFIDCECVLTCWWSYAGRCKEGRDNKCEGHDRLLHVVPDDHKLSSELKIGED